MHLFPEFIKDCRVMVFVDGENLAFRYAKELEPRLPCSHVVYEHGVFVWSRSLNLPHHLHCDTIRRHYYTTAKGDEPTRRAIVQRLKDVGIEAPRVFHKDKARGSKRVDITLAVEMLGHACRGNYDLAVLVAGDEDYVPLVQEVAAEGKRVVLWFLENGLSPDLRDSVDYFFNIGEVLFNDSPDQYIAG